MQRPSVAIIVINWNGYAFTKACLDSLMHCKYANFHIFLVDNASKDNSGEQLKLEFPQHHFIQSAENIGFTGGNNLGIRLALEYGFDYILLLNNDTIVKPDFLDHLISSLEANPALAAVQPKMYFMLDKQKIWNAGGSFNKYFGITRSIGIGKVDRGQYNESKETEWITGCCMLVRSDVIRQVGMLDDRFFAYWEDVDWSFRMKAAGWKLWYEPKSVIYHWAGVSSTSKVREKEGFLSPMAIFWEVRNHLFVVRAYSRWPQAFFWWFYQVGKITAFIVYFIIRRRWVKLRMVYKGILEGF